LPERSVGRVLFHSYRDTKLPNLVGCHIQERKRLCRDGGEGICGGAEAWIFLVCYCWVYGGFGLNVVELNGKEDVRVLRVHSDSVLVEEMCKWQKLERKNKTYNRRDSQMVTHSSTSRPVQCLCMAERTGCPVLTDLWSYVSIGLSSLFTKLNNKSPGSHSPTRARTNGVNHHSGILSPRSHSIGEV
jgi:hypothetical protein